jgi:preprotein translocase subunit SecD
MLTPLKKIIIIFVVTLIAAYIGMPKRVPIKFDFAGVNIDRVLVRNDLNVNIAGKNIQRNFDPVLGLDLAGGSHLVFEADTSQIGEVAKSEAIESVKTVIESRVNLFGISEPNVQTSSFQGKDRIVVELPGVHDPNDAIELIGQTAQLLFAEVGEDFTLIPTDLTGADLESAKVVFDPTSGKPVVGIEFTSEGAEKFAQITGRNVGKQVAILLDGIPVSSPVVQQQISGGSAQITGEFSLEQAKSLAIQLNAGALPIPVRLVEQRTVGATLGAESVDKSVKAGVIGLVMVYSLWYWHMEDLD